MITTDTSNTMGIYGRVSGLVSGLDTDSIVKQMIEADSYRLHQYQQDEQRYEWQEEKYRSVNLDLGNFIVNTKKDMELSSGTDGGVSINRSIESVSWLKKAVSSNTAVVTAAANGDAVPGRYDVTVTKLAKGVQAVSSTTIQTISGATAGLSSKLSNLDASISGTIDNLYINGKLIDGLTGDSTIKDLITKVNSSGAGVSLSYDENIGRFFVASTSNGASNARLQLTKDSGSTTVLDGNAGTLAAALQLTITRGDGTVVPYNAATALDDLASSSNIGQDAVYGFAGAAGLTSGTNQVTVNGINMTLTAIGSSSISVETDVDTIVAKTKKFFEEDYNGLIGKLSSQIHEEVYRDYQPLLDNQKESMKEDEITKWEEKAKSGLLKNDGRISSMLGSLREAVYKEVKGDGIDPKYNALYKIGITTKSYFDGGKDGELQVDERKLRDALADNPEAVINLLFKNSTDSYTSSTMDKTVREQTKNEMGVVGRVYNEMALGIKSIIDKAGFGSEENTLRNIGVGGSVFLDYVINGSKSILEKDMIDIKTRMGNEQDRLNRQEDMYYRRFTALEQAISRMNSQSTWLSQQVGSTGA